MGSKVLCSKIVKGIFLADLHSDSSVQKTPISSYERQILKTIRDNTVVKEIQDEYNKFRCSHFLSQLIAQECHVCKSDQRKSSDERLAQAAIDIPSERGVKSWSSPSEYDETSEIRTPSARSVTRGSATNLISNPSVFDTPRALDVFSDSSVFFSDDASTVFAEKGGGKEFKTKTSRSSLSGNDGSAFSGELYRKDLDVYMAASASVQHPVLMQKSDAYEYGSKEELLLHRSTRSTIDILSHYLRIVFHPLSSKDHKEYQAMLASNTPKDNQNQAMRIQLFFQLQQLEKNENKYYTESDFQTKEDFLTWKDNERRNLCALLDQNLVSEFLSPGSVPSNRNRFQDFKTLVMKVLKHEAGNHRTKNESVSSVMPENINREKETQGSASLRKSLFPPRAKRLLGEFAARYRITAVSRHVAVIQCLKRCCDQCILQFEDTRVLQEMLTEITCLSHLLTDKSNCHVILCSELNIAIDWTAEVINEVESLLCTFMSDWQFDKKKLLLSLKLLEQCCNFQSAHANQLSVEYPNCIRSWFEKAIRNDYYKYRQPQCADCVRPQTFLVLRAVSHALDTIRSGDNAGYQGMFSTYVEDVARLTGAVLYDCVLSDVCLLKSTDETLKQPMKSMDDMEEMTVAMVLVSKLAEFEAAVFETGYRPTPSDFERSWRNAFFDQSRIWLEIISNQLQTFILKCIQSDAAVTIRNLQKEKNKKVTVGFTSSGSSQDDGVVITRVENPGLVIVEEGKSEDICERNDQLEQASVVGCMRLAAVNCTERRQSMLVAESRVDSGTHELGSSACTTTKQKPNNAPFTCTHSSVNFVVLLSRFISWTGNIIQALYHLPEELKSNRRLCITTYENKEQFSVKVFKIFSSAFMQYVDCTLNLDLCLLPKIQTKRLVGAEKRKQLRERARNGTVNCCRHQLENLAVCKDNVNEQNMFKSRGSYKKMSRRIGNVTLICGGFDVIWEQLFVALEITSLSTISRSSSSSSLEFFESTSLECPSDNDSNVSTDVDDVEKITVARYTSSRAKSTRIQDMSLIQENAAHSQRENSPCEKIYPAQSIKQVDGREKASSFTVRQSSLPPVAGSEEKAHSDRFVKVPQSTNRVPLGRSISLAPHHCRSTGTTEASFMMETLVTLVMGKAEGAVEETASALCRMWSWRVARHIRECITEAFKTFSPVLKLSKQSLQQDIHECERHCHKLTDETQRILQKTVTWLQPDMTSAVHSAMWMELITEFKECVKLLKDFGVQACSRAFFLLISCRLLIRQFATFGFLTLEQLAEDLQPTLSVLELFVMPSGQIMDVYDSLEEKEFSSDSATDAYLVRSLCHQHKSFTGRYLMTKVKQHLSTKCSEYEAEQKAMNKCRELFNVGLVKLVFVKNSAQNCLPELIEYENALTSSCDILREDKDERTPTSSDVSSYQTYDTESDNQQQCAKFLADEDHVYRFEIDHQSIPLYHFSDVDGKDLKLDLLREILLTRERTDRIARDFLKREVRLQKWLILNCCSCLH